MVPYASLCLVAMYIINSCFKFTWFGNNYYTCSFTCLVVSEQMIEKASGVATTRQGHINKNWNMS